MKEVLRVPVIASKLQPLHDSIVISEMSFEEETSAGGIVLLNDDGKSEGVKSRWGKVFAVGPEQTDVTVGEWILLEHGRWSRGFTVLDEEGKDFVIRRADINAILAVSDEKPSGNIFGQHGMVHHPSVDPSTFASASFEQ
jgi:co-chaperonin GroES (HSP10)